MRVRDLASETEKSHIVPLAFVILRHHGVEEPHFDLMFEASPGGMLATWRSGRWPIDTPTSVRRLRDHRRAFLTFEGELSGDRGRVQRVDEGELELQVINSDLWELMLKSSYAVYRLRLERDTAGGEDAWVVRPIAAG